MTTPDPAATPEVNPPAVQPPVTPDAADLGDAGKRAIDRMKAERDQAVNERAEFAARIKAIEDRDLSELQKAQRDREEAIAERDRVKSETEQLRASDLRKQVALEKGLPASLLSRLVGSTAEELSADADALLTLMNAPRTPLPDPGQGPRQVSQQSAEDAEYAAYRAALFPTNQ